MPFEMLFLQICAISILYKVDRILFLFTALTLMVGCQKWHPACTKPETG